MTRVVQLLRADSAVEAVFGDDDSPTNVKVYGELPDKPVFPYCRVETIDAEDASTKDGGGAVTMFRCHVFSNYRGEAEAADGCDAIEDVLHDADLSAQVSGFVYCLHVRTQRLPDPDEAVIHFAAEFEVMHLA